MKIPVLFSLFLVSLCNLHCLASERETCEERGSLESTLQRISKDWRYLNEYVEKELVINPNSAGALRTIVEVEERNIQNEIKTLKKAIESSLPQPSVIPAFQWAQGSNDIFLNIKFSHKIDAPATLDVQPMRVNLTSDELKLEATDGRKNFNLHIGFLHKVDPSNSTWSLASVGRMVFHIRKEQEKPSKWKRLLKSDKRLGQMHYWYEMGEKYAKELEDIEDLSESDSGQEKASFDERLSRKKRMTH